jgi:glycosyltransferase involved in cell wall biosynthesis
VPIATAPADAPARTRRIALVTAGYAFGGGVPTVAGWLLDRIRATSGYCVDLHDLATSSRDPSSRRLAAPASWLRRSLRSHSDAGETVTHWGANAVEIETMRYRPRSELTRALQDYDLIQVVSGTGAWASPVIGSGVPVVLQVATAVAWERRWLLSQQTGFRRTWRKAMTAASTHVEQRALREVDAVLVENREMRDYVRSTGQQQVYKVPPGVDTEFWSPHPSGWEGDGYLLTVCRLNEPRKGLERLVRAYSHIVRAGERAPRLVIAGQGALSAPTSKLVSDLGLSPRVTVISDVDVGGLADIYRGASVFLQTSYEEGLGMAVLEAMACGLPTVCTRTAGTRETVLDGVTGWLVDQDAELRVARAIADRVLEVLHSDGGGMGARGRERCETQFSSDVAFQRFKGVYEDLLASA